MKYRCFAALALAMLLPGCAAAPDLTPVWQRDLPASGVHIELANAQLLSDADVYYAATREELYVHNVSVLPAVKADGQPVVTFTALQRRILTLCIWRTSATCTSIMTASSRRSSWITS